MEGYRRVETGNTLLDRIQDGIFTAIRPFTRSSILDGRLIRDVVLAMTTDTVVNHRLGRRLEGWIVVRKNAFADVQEIRSGKRQLVLQADVAVTVTLWVF